jgi:DNA processing protein
VPELSDAEKRDWLRLIRTPSIGPITFHRLLARFGSAGAALEALPELSRKAGRAAALKPPPRARIDDEIAEADRHGARIIAACEPDFPDMLAAIPDPPPVLFLRGHAALFEKPAMAIVGARNASAAGRKMARTLASHLGAAGMVITSGLARGIDGAAHEASLETGAIAVVAGGVDVVYPPEHEDLTERIAKRGALLSESPMGHAPKGRDFPRRNRLISGLSRGVVVVEAAAKSGTLITARFALEQGREVFAVPGSPLDPRCHGANRLIREGATLVERAEDILDVLAEQNRGVSDRRRDLFSWAESSDEHEPDPAAVLSLRRRILELLSYTPIHRDELLRELDAPPGLVADALLDLVLSEEAMEHEGGRFSRPPPD